MQKFEYRTPRYLVELPIQFLWNGQSIRGRCKEISKDGMRVVLEQQVPVESCGEVEISYKEFTWELHCCVAHKGPDFDGLKFLFESDKDRGSVERLVALVSGPSGPPGPVLVR
jgi:hypothetical protein